MKFSRWLFLLSILTLPNLTSAFGIHNKSSFTFSFSANGVCASSLVGNIMPNQSFNLTSKKLQNLCGDMSNKKFCDIAIYASENCAELLTVTIATIIQKPYIWDLSELYLPAIHKGINLSASGFDIFFGSRDLD